MSISDDVVSRCKSAPERSTFAPHPYYSLSTSEVPPTSQPEKETTTSSRTSRTRSRATGQGTIDQYFIKKKEAMQVSQLRGTDISSSLSANKNVSQRSRRSRPDPPIGTTSSSITTGSSICNTSTNEVLSTAEQREDSRGNSFCDGHANQRDSDLLLPSPLESDASALSINLEAKNVSPLNSCQEIKKSGEDFVSYKGKCPPEDHSSRIDLSALSQHKSYLCRTVQIPPGKVGAVLYTSPLGPAVQSIKSTSSIYGQVEVGDLIVELDGVDTTERRAKEVTEMLINSADRERQIVVLKEKTFDVFEQDEPSIGEDSIDRYLALDDDGDDEQALALASATVASGQTARAGNTRAHNKARNPAMDCSTRTAAKVELANSETAYVEAVSAKFTKSTKDNTCTSYSCTHEEFRIAFHVQ